VSRPARTSGRRGRPRPKPDTRAAAAGQAAGAAAAVAVPAPTRRAGPAGDPLPVPPAVPVRAERVLRLAGTAVGVGTGVLSAVWELFLSPLYAGAVPLPVAPVLAVAGALGLIWFTRTVTGSRELAMLPGAAWFTTMLVAMFGGSGGDSIISWMGVATILVGAATWGVAGYRLIGRVNRAP